MKKNLKILVNIYKKKTNFIGFFYFVYDIIIIDKIWVINMTKSEQDSIKQYRIIAIVIIVALFVFVLSIIGWKHSSYFTSNTVNIVVTEGDLTINYIDGDEFYYKGKKSSTYNISIANYGSSKVFYSLDLDDVKANNSVEIIVKDNEGNEVYKDDDVDSDITLLSLLSIQPSETARYSIILSSKKNVDFKAKFTVINDSLTTQSFSDLILLNNNISIPKTKIGKEASETYEGLLSASDNDGVSYYFRGVNDSNYIQINDLMFRVVRINGDGSVRLILDDTIAAKAAYNTNSLEEGHEVKELALFEKASILETLNSWYESALSEYDNVIVPSSFCSETEFVNLNGGFYRSGAYNRLYFSNEPSLKCEGTIYKNKVGLLSADEATFAGAFQDYENKKYYLYNENISDTVILGSSDYVNTNNEIVMFGFNPDGSLNDDILFNKVVSIRPVINLGPNAKVKGKGTIDNPFIIVS